MALGNSHELLDAKHDANKLPSGMHSVKGLGQVVPDPSETLTLCVLEIGLGIMKGGSVDVFKLSEGGTFIRGNSLQSD